MVGPTAIGKSALAMRVARQIDCEIVSIDSAMVYRHMDIGTDKPSVEDRAAVVHHMIDVVEPHETLSVAMFQTMARAAIGSTLDKGKVPLLVGGSGLYFRAVVDQLEFPATDPSIRGRIAAEAETLDPAELHSRLRALDPKAADRIEPANVRRTIRALEVIEVTGRKFSSFRWAWDDHRSIYPLATVGLTAAVDELDAKIDSRVDRLIAQGLVDEIASLKRLGFDRSLTAVQALGYAQILAHLDGRSTLEDAIDEVKRKTRRFARRQLVWFRADPRVVWFQDHEQAASYLLERALGKR
ncbi:MAG: tRNA (adenosine(37)-N6)-dimethylallyltransferase MiaA [Actinomycetota bacterium]